MPDVSAHLPGSNTEFSQEFAWIEQAAPECIEIRQGTTMLIRCHHKDGFTAAYRCLMNGPAWGKRTVTVIKPGYAWIPAPIIGMRRFTTVATTYLSPDSWTLFQIHPGPGQ
ncbi:hypothetical protein AC579_5209 [Pseudocercospora musae]|uniref:Uncharacterized protein n=1 Tax=Pseudocercospora musae TaxID=113226 RepID=A0A139IDI7_9PEZI|nr:hypothetical protein AC579_5209 [Pseudocercospora musae]